VSSDLVASAVMKPVSGLVHLRRGTVNLKLVAWLCAGSVPAAFAGVLIARALGDGERVQGMIRTALAVALLVPAAGRVARAYVQLTERAARRNGRLPAAGEVPGPLADRPVATVLLGVVGGLVVGITSVGSGSIIIIVLLALYPTLQAGQLVGTDLVQAVPRVASAALGHLLFGQFSLTITASLLLGSIPGVHLGAQLSSRAPGGLVRKALALVLLSHRRSSSSTLETPERAFCFSRWFSWLRPSGCSPGGGTAIPPCGRRGAARSRPAGPRRGTSLTLP
jgi:uncharacterized protein